MSSRWPAFVLTACLGLPLPASAADTASGAVTVQKLGAISPKHAVAYLVRDQRNARTTQTEILLSEVPVDPSAVQTAFDPHMAAINVDALRDRNYVLLFVNPDGRIGMNATFGKTMTQFLNDTSEGLKAEITTRTATRLEGRLFSGAPLKTLDGSSYTVDLRFAVDVPAQPAGTALPAGGGEPGKALTAFVAAAAKKNWAAIKMGSSPAALQMFEKSYNSEKENADGAADLLGAWLPLQKMRVTGGQLRGDVATLDVEGEMFPGTLGLSIVRMVKAGAAWQFDRAARAGLVK
jgi:hypothetical protein